MSNDLPFLQRLPADLSGRLESLYKELKTNFVHRRFKTTVLDAAQFCEVVYCILQWKTSEDEYYTPIGESIRNFCQSVSRFECKSASDDSIRFHIPNALKTIYTIRNKRGVGHIAKEVDPNLMDATLVVTCADWIMAELVRLFHNLPIVEAQKIVNNLVTKRIPIIWRVGDTDRRRILNPPDRNLSAKDKILLLLHDVHPKPMTVGDLLSCTEYKNTTLFRTKVLTGLHNDFYIDFDKEADLVHLSPLGLDYAEKNLPHDFVPVK